MENFRLRDSCLTTTLTLQTTFNYLLDLAFDFTISWVIPPGLRKSERSRKACSLQLEREFLSGSSCSLTLTGAFCAHVSWWAKVGSCFFLLKHLPVWNEVSRTISAQAAKTNKKVVEQTKVGNEMDLISEPKFTFYLKSRHFSNKEQKTKFIM